MRSACPSPHVWPPRPPVTAPVVLVLPARDEAPRHRRGDRPPVRPRRWTADRLPRGRRRARTPLPRWLVAGADVVRHEISQGLGGRTVPVSPRRRPVPRPWRSATPMVSTTRRSSSAWSAPIARGEAHYVVVAFRWDDRAHASAPAFGNRVLTACRASSPVPITDGQSGYRALSRARLASRRDRTRLQLRGGARRSTLVSKGFGYHEVPITYRFRHPRAVVHPPRPIPPSRAAGDVTGRPSRRRRPPTPRTVRVSRSGGSSGADSSGWGRAQRVGGRDVTGAQLGLAPDLNIGIGRHDRVLSVGRECVTR